MRKRMMQTGKVLLGLVSGALLVGCGELIGLALMSSADTPEDKAAVADFTKKYDATSAAAKEPGNSIESHFQALILAVECNEPKSALQETWKLKTVDGDMTVRQAKEKCGEIAREIRKKVPTEEGCGYSFIDVIGGRQRPGMDWSTDVDFYITAGASRWGYHWTEGSRQVASCDKVPAKNGTPPPIWKQDHIKAAERGCEGVLVYTSTDWNIHSIVGSDPYLERRLEAQCWYPKGKIDNDFTVPPACKTNDALPEGAYSCLTAAGKLITP